MRKVIILGQEHHNALNVARQLWMGKIEAYGIIVHTGKVSCIKYSRYWKECRYVRNEYEGINLAIELYGNKNVKPIIITCTDKYAECVDQNLDKLKEFFVCPGVDNQGLLTKMMDKKWQHDFAQQNGINVVPSVELTSMNHTLTHLSSILREKGIVPPYIIKPIVSAFGDKTDIQICQDIDKLLLALQIFNKKNYERVIVQHLLDYDFEMLITGACFIHSKLNKFILLKTYRSYPIGRGTGCYRRFILDKELNNQADNILSVLQSTGYHGLVDVELFCKNGCVYLNEFNLRSSGSSFAGISQRFLYAVDYVMDAMNKDVKVRTPYEIPDNISYTMTEYSDVRFPLYYNYGWRKWLKDLYNVNDYAYFHLEDPIPMLLHYLKIIIFIILRREW